MTVGVWSQRHEDDERPLPLKGATLSRIDDERFVLFGGVGGGFSNETYLLSGWKWTRLTATTKPMRRAYHIAVEWQDRVVIFGGVSGNDYFNDVWTLQVDTRAVWTTQERTGPRKREGHAAVVMDETMVVFGGYDGVEFLADVQCFDMEMSVWRPLSVAGQRPSGRSGHTLELSPVDDDRCFVLGGYNDYGCLSNFGIAIFTLDLVNATVTWEDPATVIFGSLRPAPRYGHSTSLLDDTIVIFGGTGPVRGYGADRSGGTTYNDVHLSAEINFEFLSFVGLHFYFLTWSVSCVLEVVIIPRRDE